MAAPPAPPPAPRRIAPPPLLNGKLKDVWKAWRDTDMETVSTFIQQLSTDTIDMSTNLHDAQAIQTRGDEELSNEQLLHTQSLHTVVRLSMRNLWRTHTHLRDLVKPDSPPLAREALRTSWVNVCRSVILEAQLRDMIREKTSWMDWTSELDVLPVKAFLFVGTCERYGFPIVTSDKCIGTYSVRTLMSSLSYLCQALDTHGWTPSAGAYLEALFLRYCLIVQQPGVELADPLHDMGPWRGSVPPPPEGGGEGEGEGDDDSEDDEGDEPIYDEQQVFVKAPPAPPPDPRLHPSLLHSGFLDTGERFFFHHMWRHRALESMWFPLLRTPMRVSLQHARARWRYDSGLPRFTHVLTGMWRDPVLQSRMAEDLASFYPYRVLQPGEREQFMFQYREEDDGRGDPYNVLYRLRYDEYARMQQLIKFDAKTPSDPTRYLDQYVASERALAQYVMAHYPVPVAPAVAFLTEGEWIDLDRVRTRAGVEHERLLLLWFEHAFNKRLAPLEKNIFTSYAYVDDQSLQGDQCRCPASKASFLQHAKNAPEWPHFMATWQHYVVVNHQGTHSLCTPHLVDAVGAWLTLARRQSEHGGALLAHTMFKDKRNHAWRQLEMPLDLLDHA